VGQKVHPNGFRLGIHKGWASNWFVSTKDFGFLLEEDHRIRNFIKKELQGAGVSKVEINRKADQINIDIYTARLGVAVGKGGQGIESLHQKIRGMLNRQGIDIKINILEINRVDLESQLVAESIAQQLEKRVAFRRAMKQAVQRCMRAGAVGVKIMVAGRLGGAEIARTEWTKEGRIPLQTLRADVDYGLAEAHTMMGLIGIKVWIFRGELERGQWSPPNVKAPSERPDQAANRAERGGGGGDRGRQGRRGRGGGGGHERGDRGGDRGGRGGGGGGGGGNDSNPPAEEGQQ
jgi:small subunit ribosomal protein S3